MKTLALLLLASFAPAFELKTPEPKPIKAEVEARALAFKYLADHPELGVAPDAKPRRDDCTPLSDDYWICVLNFPQMHQGVRVEYGEIHVVVSGMTGKWDVRENGRRQTGLTLSVVPGLTLAEAKKALSKNVVLPCFSYDWSTPAHELTECAIPASFIDAGGELVIFTGYPGENKPAILAWKLSASMSRIGGSGYTIFLDASTGRELQTLSQSIQ